MGNKWKTPTRAEWLAKEPETIKWLPVLECSFEFGYSESVINKIYKEYQHFTEISCNPDFNGARVMCNIDFWNIVLNTRFKQ